MRKEIKKAPTIRFQGFTDEWEQHKLGELAGKTYGGGTPRTSEKTFWNGQVPWFQSSDLIEDKVLSAIPKKKITENGLQKSAAQLIPENSIAIITRVGVGKLAFIPFSYSTSQDFLSLSALNIDGKFGCYSIYKLLQREKKLTQGTSIKGITKKELLRKILWIPCQDEQIKIGRYIANIDNLITLHQRKLDQLKKLKKYFLQNMFPAKGEKVPRIRFKGFTGDWEQHKLSDLVEKICVGFVGTCEKYYTDVADGIPMYRTGDLSGFALNHTGIKYVTREFHKKNKKSQLKYGDILIARHGDSGKAIVYDRNEEANCLNIVIIRPNSARCNGKFLAQRINTFSVSHKIKKMAAGSTQIVINTTDIEKLILQIPKNLNEQAKIISCFISIDNLITFHQRKLTQVQTMKKFMLQNLFI